MSEHEYTFGIEEEFFITQLDTHNIARQPAVRFFRECKKRFGHAISHELLQSQIELITPICYSSQQAREQLCTLRSEVNAIANRYGYALLSAGTHPLAEWREQMNTERDHYEALMSDFQIIAQRNLLCGMHVHVAVPKQQDRMQLIQRLMPFLPFLLCLSASSPFWNRKRTGLMSYRQAAYDEWPRTGIPDRFSNEENYQQFVSMLFDAGSIRSKSSLWWNIRPSLKYPTIELRICDALTNVEDSVMLADVFRCLVRAVIHDQELGARYNEMTRLLIDENRWRAKRYGIGAAFYDQWRLVNLTSQDYWAELQPLLAEHGQALNCSASLQRVDKILHEGSSAHQQLKIYHQQKLQGSTRRQALNAVVEWLLDETLRIPVAA
jgi:glutamate---cysteine ligase / carboxylate-amine ligase